MVTRLLRVLRDRRSGDGGIEPLDRDAVYSRIGGPLAPREGSHVDVTSYFRIDGPPPVRPRTWRASAAQDR